MGSRAGSGCSCRSGPGYYRRNGAVPFFFVWSVTTLALIAAAAGLDDGVESPVTGMLVLPVLFAALVYPLTTVVVLALVAEVFYESSPRMEQCSARQGRR